MLLLWQSRPQVTSWSVYDEWTFTRDLPEVRRKKDDDEFVLLWWMLYQ